MCPCCRLSYSTTRTQCTWCRRFICWDCIRTVALEYFAADEVRRGFSHFGCTQCVEERMTGQDKAESAFESLAKPDTFNMSDMADMLGRAVAQSLDDIALKVFIAKAKLGAA